MSLTGKTKAGSYKDILQMNNSNSGVDTTARNVVDGEGTASSISLSDDSFSIKPQNDDSTGTFEVFSKDLESLIRVNSANDYVTILGHYANTQYAYFGVTNTDSANFADDTHQAIPFGGSNGVGNLSYPPAFGTGTELSGLGHTLSRNHLDINTGESTTIDEYQNATLAPKDMAGVGLMAIKELIARIETLETEVAALKE